MYGKKTMKKAAKNWPDQEAEDPAQGSAVQNHQGQKEKVMAKKSQVNKAGNYTKAGMRKHCISRSSAPTRTAAGKWSARKPSCLPRNTRSGPGLPRLMRAPQKSLKDWGKQKWRTKSGKKSSAPARGICRKQRSSRSAQRICCHYEGERKAKRQGKQFSKQPESIMKKQGGSGNSPVRLRRRPHARLGDDQNGWPSWRTGQGYMDTPGTKLQAPVLTGCLTGQYRME